MERGLHQQPNAMNCYFYGMTRVITEYPQFFTATNLEWKKLFEKDDYKDIVIRSMRFLIEGKRVIIYGFVIMPNHIHIVWQMQAGKERRNVQSRPGKISYSAPII